MFRCCFLRSSGTGQVTARLFVDGYPTQRNFTVNYVDSPAYFGEALAFARNSSGPLLVQEVQQHGSIPGTVTRRSGAGCVRLSATHPVVVRVRSDTAVLAAELSVVSGVGLLVLLLLIMLLIVYCKPRCERGAFEVR